MDYIYKCLREKGRVENVAQEPNPKTYPKISNTMAEILDFPPVG